MKKTDILNILALLNRVDLKGNEAAELVRLQQLLTNLAMEAKDDGTQKT